MPRIEAVRKDISFEEYLELERDNPIRHEFVDGQLFAMAGASERHNRLALALAMWANQAAEETDCRVLISDVKLRTPQNVTYYPDVMVSRRGA